MARAVRQAYGRGLALVGQDVIRREVLRERDRPGGVNIGLIDTIVRYSLDHGYHVLLEGILYADRYGDMLQSLRDDHRGATYGYYFDVAFAETLRRHATKPQAADYGESELREWYRERDLLPGGWETIIGQDSSLEATVQRVLDDSGLMSAPAQR
ncbi:kinase [Planomonospora sp. ID82291]|uniref:kinase n=1 Tax=Planomonospora sp. ID82291 TaxID=2738136 RepID=UPI0027DBD4A4|nr:kinase [Planomonospora sp. ID82291]